MGAVVIGKHHKKAHKARKLRQKRSRHTLHKAHHKAHHHAMKTDVTKAFCKQILADVAGGKAPYWAEGKLTASADDVREEMKADCEGFICHWAEKYDSHKDDKSPC